MLPLSIMEANLYGKIVGLAVRLRSPRRDWPRQRQEQLNVTDADLIEKLQAGDTDALGDIYDRYSPLVYGLSLRMLGNRQEAEDLTHEIFLKLYQGGRYNHQRGTLGSYLMTLTRSRAIDRLRSHSNRRQILNRWQQDLCQTRIKLPAEQASLLERQAQVRLALSQLSEMQRQVLELSYYEGLSQSEIAKRLQKPLGTVKSWARKGLLQLRNQLKDESDDV
ncbi:ECF RNA polymerase sigma factor SigK [Acaryochloris thomasi RCC1774]|uniref:ECF RNA polymerase sigma factor SigK n=2 Tax=Acaryochloris TaxID=155977 RepID=A0A2W1JN94_9CYAN|nr:ECF RNA polymerase sigma factor SigK [Acaryochloris thomasi RCC1774]